jgi:nucleotide-binding universal stress UspA family protein
MKGCRPGGIAPLRQIKGRREAALHHRPIAPKEMTMKILLAVDGSEYTKRMLSYIAAHDELLGPGHDYVVLTAVAAIPAHAARYLDRHTLDGYYKEQAQQVLQPISAFVEQQRWKARLLHAVGPAAEVIAQQVEAEKPDLVVMGSHGHSALGSMVLGSVATGVLARCKVPVLLVR